MAESKPVYNDLIGDILKNSEDGGKVDHLAGAGQPLSPSYLSENTFQHFQRIAKDACYKPEWLKLQHEIRDELKKLVDEAKQLSPKELNKRVKEVNGRIAKYNRNCPPPFLKGKVFVEKIQEAVKIWQ